MWVLHLVVAFIGHPVGSIGNATHGDLGRWPVNGSALPAHDTGVALPVPPPHEAHVAVDYGSGAKQVVAVEPDGLERRSRAELVELDSVDKAHSEERKATTDVAPETSPTETGGAAPDGKIALKSKLEDALDATELAEDTKGAKLKKGGKKQTRNETAIVVVVSIVIALGVIGAFICVLRGGTGYETDVPTRRGKLVTRFDGQNFDPVKAEIARRLPCPVVAVLLANNEIEGLYTYSEKGQSDRPDGEATFLISLAAVHEMSMKLGADPRCAHDFVVALRTHMASSHQPLAPSSARQVLPDSATYIDLLHHTEYGAGYDCDTRIRDNPSRQPDEAAFRRFLGFANVLPGYESLGNVMTLADVKEWYKAAKSARQGRDGTLDGLIPHKVLFEVFGKEFGVYDTRKYLSEAALRAIFLEMRFPEGYVPFLRDRHANADWQHGQQDSHA